MENRISRRCTSCASSTGESAINSKGRPLGRPSYCTSRMLVRWAQPFTAILRASACTAAVEALVAGAVADHDLAAVRAAWRVLLIEERHASGRVRAVGVLGGGDEADGLHA